MTYDSNIPQILPPPNIAVDSIRINFSDYNTIFATNHIAINSSHQGQHENVIFQEQTLDPEINNTFDALYSKSVTTNSSTSQELFLKIPQFIPGKQNFPQQITFNSVNTAGPVYQTFLPGGYVFYFGMINAVPATITLVPAPTKILSAVANANNYNGGLPNVVNVEVINTTQFVIRSITAVGGNTFTWMAVALQ